MLRKLSFGSEKQWQLSLFIILAGWFFVFLWTHFQGDDLGYKSTFEGQNPRYESWLYYLRYVVSHWLHSNGRLANYVAPLLLALPQLIISLICTFMLGLMYYMSVLVSNTSGSITGNILVGAIFFGLPWWDYLTLFDCQTNYVWTSAAVLLAVWIVFHKEGGGGWWAVILCMLAAMMHESASCGLIAGFLVFYLINKPSLTSFQKKCLAAFFIGAFLTVLSPGIIWRTLNVSNVEPNDTPVILMLKSDVIALALWVLIALFAIIPHLRRHLGRVFRTPLCIFAVAAAVEILLSVKSGIVGRSGWFAELFALVVLAGWVGNPGKSARPLSWLITIAIAVVVGTCVVWQYRIHREFEVYEELYSKSADGLIFMDYTKDDEIPVVLTQNRLRGIPDSDDCYLQYTVAHYYGTDSLIPIVLPEIARDIIAQGVNSEVSLPDGSILQPNAPDTLVEIYASPERKWYVTYRNGREYVAENVKGIYYLTPRILDPGDR